MTEHETQLRIAELERSYDRMAKDLAFRTEQVEKLQAENERLKKQLGMAINDIPHDCEMCKNNNPNCLAIYCYTCGQKNCKCEGCTTKNDKWLWRRDTDRS